MNASINYSGFADLVTSSVNKSEFHGDHDVNEVAEEMRGCLKSSASDFCDGEHSFGV